MKAATCLSAWLALLSCGDQTKYFLTATVAEEQTKTHRRHHNKLNRGPTTLL